MKKLFFYSCLVLLFSTANAQSTLSLKQKADSILRLMTLDEKIGQLNMETGNWQATGPVLQNGDKSAQIQNGEIGSMLNIKGAENTRYIQSLAMKSRLKIPLLFGLDVIHGYKTIFPIPLAQASSFDTTAIKKSAEVAAKEALASGIQWVFSPMLDVAHDPRWGRVMEGPGEDPFLACAIAKCMVEGYQKPVHGLRLMACAKHFAAYGAAIGGRDYNTVDISDQTLQNLYLPPFKAAVQAGISSFMCSFNEINGVPSSANRKLYNILYNDWHFKGIVVSDWGSIGEMVTHGYSKDREQAAQQALSAGVDIDMESYCYIDYLKKLVQDKKISESLIDHAVEKILMQKLSLGLFDDPYQYCNAKRETEDILTPKNKAVALDMAHKSIVLLKNTNDLLPLKPVQHIAIIGPLGNSARDMDGNWVLQSNHSIAVTLLSAVRSRFPNATVEYVKGCNILGNDRSGFAAAINAAKSADVVLLTLGESWDMTGEARSRGDLSLPGVQEELATDIYKVNPHTVTLLMGGRPMIFNKIAKQAPAILYCWWLGTEAGNAMADVIWGTYDPSARLPMTFPKAMGQIPVFYNHKNSGRPPVETPDSYTGRYIDIDYKPRYVFGYGLSYTNFKYDDVHVSYNKDSIKVALTLTNFGNYDGSELVQIYLHKKWGEVTSPVKELKGFQQVFLKKGESRLVTINIPLSDLSYYGVSSWRNASGDYTLYVGKNSDDTIYQTDLQI